MHMHIHTKTTHTHTPERAGVGETKAGWHVPRKYCDISLLWESCSSLEVPSGRSVRLLGVSHGKWVQRGSISQESLMCLHSRPHLQSDHVTPSSPWELSSEEHNLRDRAVKRGWARVSFRSVLVRFGGSGDRNKALLHVTTQTPRLLLSVASPLWSHASLPSISVYPDCNKDKDRHLGSYCTVLSHGQAMWPLRQLITET